MSHASQDGKPAPESLRVQLTQLNERSRAYTAQLWQLPLAYVAAAGLALSNIKGAALPAALFATGVGGILVYLHLDAIDDGRCRAVKNIQRLEGELDLTQTAEHRPGYFYPLVLMLLLAASAAIGAARVLWTS